MAYRMHNVTILAEDYDKAKAILDRHYRSGDIDEMHAEQHVDRIDGENTVIIRYWVAPYIYEDFETIIAEFKQAGIRII